MKPLAILLADDESEIRHLVELWLMAAGHRVVPSASGREACAKLADGRFDLVITDLLMPDGDGVDLIAEVRKLRPTTRILAISGGGRYTEGSDVLNLAQGLGAHAVVLKPFTAAQLKTGIERAMA
jgi:CheY-like chemotaxis protein